MKKVKAPPVWVFIVAVLLLTIMGGFAGFLFGVIVSVVLLKFILISPYNEITLQQIGPHIVAQYNKLISKVKSVLITEKDEKTGAKMTGEQNNNQPTPSRPPASISPNPRPSSSGPVVGLFDPPAVCMFGLIIAIICYLFAGIILIIAMALMAEGRGWGLLFGGGQLLVGSLLLAVVGVLIQLLTTIAAKTSETAHYTRASYLITLNKK